MATINAIAHLNELTKDVTDDYYLTAEVRDTPDVPGIIKRQWHYTHERAPLLPVCKSHNRR